MVEADGKAQNGDQDRFFPSLFRREAEDNSFILMPWRRLLLEHCLRRRDAKRA